MFPIRKGCDSNSAPGLTCTVSIVHLHVNLVGAAQPAPRFPQDSLSISQVQGSCSDCSVSQLCSGRGGTGAWGISWGSKCRAFSINDTVTRSPAAPASFSPFTLPVFPSGYFFFNGFVSQLCSLPSAWSQTDLEKSTVRSQRDPPPGYVNKSKCSHFCLFRFGITCIAG